MRFKSPHTGENIQHLTEDVLDHVNIKEKDFKIITDKASSMIVDEEPDVLITKQICYPIWTRYLMITMVNGIPYFIRYDLQRTNLKLRHLLKVFVAIRELRVHVFLDPDPQLSKIDSLVTKSI